MIPHVITFTLVKKARTHLFLTGLISLLIGIGGVYWAGNLTFGGGRFLVLTLGVLGLLIAFFCIASIIYLTKEKGVGIHISEEGIYDISTGNTYGTVLWQDVKEIRIMDELGNTKRKYIVVKVHNPADYIQRERSQSKRRTLELKLQYYGSPICFSNRALNCSFNELKDAVFLKYNEYKEHEERENKPEESKL